MLELDNIKVEINRRNKGDMKAQAAIEYYGIRITHFRIMTDKSTGELWVEMPSIKVFNKYQRCFWIMENQDYPQFQELILSKYKEHVAKIKQGIIQDTVPLGELIELPDTQ